ncbi:MAG: zinc ribbon domain-containing protein [Deltaproteobacteria bacterium]|nr:zinc ribbon domain-containing protein [Deltaproteobacteria bacterium]
MPIYEYKCQECGQRFETLILSPGEEVHCQKCGSISVERQLSTFAVSSGSSGAGSSISSSCGPGGFS